MLWELRIPLVIATVIVGTIVAIAMIVAIFVVVRVVVRVIGSPWHWGGSSHRGLRRGAPEEDGCC